MGPRIGMKKILLASLVALIAVGCSGSGAEESAEGENVFKDTAGSTGRASSGDNTEAGKVGRAR